MSVSLTASPAALASSNTCANADDADRPEGVRDASPFRSIHEAKPIAAEKRLVVIAGADHNDEALFDGPELMRELLDFLAKLERR